MMGITWLGIIVLVVLAFLAFRGYRRGLVRELVASACMIVTLALVPLLNPYVLEFIQEHTPLQQTIQKGIDEFIESQEKEIIEKNADATLSVETAEAEVIKSLDLPELLKEVLTTSVSSQKKEQQVSGDTVTGKVSEYLTGLLVKGISFMISYILITIAFQVVLYGLGILTKLPVIKGVNRMAGALLGIVEGILILWVLFLFITLLGGTEIGAQLLDLISKDTILHILYERDILLQWGIKL